MKKMIQLAAVCVAAVVLSSCERVAPNYAGVLMENYGNAHNISTMSGDVRCKTIEGSVSTMSGDVTCDNIKGNCSTMNGDIRR